MASLAAYRSGIKFEKIIKVLPKIKSVEGRLEKIGDILMMSGELNAAKIKYQYVIQSFPENSASSLALQLLENME